MTHMPCIQPCPSSVQCTSAGVGKQTETRSQNCEGTFYCRANAHTQHRPPPPPPHQKKKKILLLLNITYRKHSFTGSILWGLQIYSTQDNIIPSVDKISLLL